MIPHKHNVATKRTLLEAFYNRHIFRKRVIVENVFKILQKKLEIYCWKLTLTLYLFLMLLFCCYMLYTPILDRRDIDVDALMD
jgi:hypothetical protein